VRDLLKILADKGNTFKNILIDKAKMKKVAKLINVSLNPIRFLI